MKKDKSVLDDFGRFMMANLRDRAVECCEAPARGEWRAPGLQPLQKKVGKITPAERAVLRQVVIESTDPAIHDFLFQVQEIADHDVPGGLEIHLRGVNVAKLSDGLHGEPFGEDGWQARFSAFGAASD